MVKEIEPLKGRWLRFCETEEDRNLGYNQDDLDSPGFLDNMVTPRLCIRVWASGDCWIDIHESLLDG